LSSRGFGFRKFYPNRLVDASTSAPFGLDVSGAALGAYVQINLDAPVCVTRMKLWTSGINLSAKFQIQGSNDGSWTNLLASDNLFAPTLSGENTKTFTNATSYQRYRLVLAYGAGTHTVTLYEMAMYSIPQVVVASDDVPAVTSEITSLLFRNNQFVDIGVDPYLEATYTFAAPLELAKYNLAYLWVKSNVAGSMVGNFTCTSTDLTAVDTSIEVPVADTWTRIPIDLSSLVLVDGVIDLVSFKFTPSIIQGVEVGFGALTIGETLVLKTRNLDGTDYIPIHSDTSAAYLFFTSTALAPALESDFGVTCTPQSMGPLTPPTFSGSFHSVIQAGTVYDVSAAANTTLYAAKFDLASELNGNYCFTFFAPISLTGLNILGWAVSRKV
jgi:hypothetical protein